MNFQRMQAIGRIGIDATLGTYQDKRYANFSLAVNYQKKDGGEHVTWYDCSWYNPAEKLLPYLTKGSVVLVEGIPQPKKFTNKNNEEKLIIVIHVHTVVLISSMKSDNGTQAESAAGGFDVM